MNGENLRLACVGNVVRYVDGSESSIISGAGRAVMYKDKPFAMTGSFLDNGDIIATSLQASVLEQWGQFSHSSNLLKCENRPRIFYAVSTFAWLVHDVPCIPLAMKHYAIVRVTAS